MKKNYLLILFLLCFFAQAQIVNFTDANFKAKLVSITSASGNARNLIGQNVKIDLNSDGEIQQSEASQISYLNLTNSGTNIISNAEGINSFSNIKFINFASNNLTSLILNLPLLEELNLNSNYTLGSLNVTNCTSLKKLYLQGNQLSSLNLQNSTLTDLIVMYNNLLTTINLQGCNSLINLSVSNSNNISSLNLGNLASLKKVEFASLPAFATVNFQGSSNLFEITIGSTSLSSIDLQNLNSLYQISFGGNSSLQNVLFGGNSNLKYVSLDSNNLSTINVSSLQNIIQLNLSNNSLTSLNASNLAFLQFLTCNNNNISNVNILNTPSLKNFYINNNDLTTLNFQPSTLFYAIQCSGNNLTSLDVSSLSQLYSLDCSYNNLTHLNLNNNPALSIVECQGNNSLTSIFTKNGSSQAVSSSHFFPNPALQYICCDDNEISYFNSYNNTYNNNTISINSYCSFTPGGTFYLIQGNTKYDSNNNGCDINDINKQFQKFAITNGSTIATIIANNSGDYYIPVQAGTHTITPILENPTYFNVSPTTFVASLPTMTSPVTQNFCLTANGDHNDLEVLIIPVTGAAPGFNAKYKIIYKNKGTTTQSGTLSYSYDDNLMNFLSSTVVPISQTTGALNWNFANLAPMESREIILTFTLNTPTQTPPLSSGNILTYTAQVNGATDETPTDNVFTLNQTVVNSFDPNDKTCLEGTSIALTKVGDYVHYLIRFENTGTANAQNIVVKDIIDTNKYDINSLIAMNASHSFVTKITNSNTVEFIFENIQLPFNNATNDGYISFKIKTKTTLGIGDSFSNSANIYFDYNAPITTNTYTTTVQSFLSTSEDIKEKDDIVIYPNPVKDFIFLKTTKEIVKTEIFDSAGRILLTTNGDKINTTSLSKGVYYIKLFDKDKFWIKTFIKN